MNTFSLSVPTNVQRVCANLYHHMIVNAYLKIIYRMSILHLVRERLMVLI
jgi:hypothetical protein